MMVERKGKGNEREKRGGKIQKRNKDEEISDKY